MIGFKEIFKALKIFSQGVLLLLLFGFVDSTALQEEKSEFRENKLVWSLQLPDLGTLSSPRVSDLTGDGVLDVILGAGGIEFEATDTGILALDGKSGEVLWKRPAIDQIYGSPSMLDINGDGVDDVVIGGRSSTFQAISGKDGALIWDFLEANRLQDQAQVSYFNFYNSQLLPDLSGDGIPDLIVTNGGDVHKKPFDPDRPAGKILVLDSSNGKLLKEVQTPDKKETYHSLTLSNHSTVEEIQVVFGTGGETIGGNLFLVSLRDILNGTMERAHILAQSKTNGFIAPVVWIDLTGDGVEDIVANAVEGSVFAIDGRTKKELWKITIPGTEIYSTPAVGQFTEDQIPDIFVNASTGVWPDFSDCHYVLIDGAKGKIKFAQRFGNFQSTSPLVVDTNGDGMDEVLISDNRQRIDALRRKTFYTTVSVLDFKQGGLKKDLLIPLAGNNISSTPWMGDLDGDQVLDIVFCHSNNLYHTFSFDGLRINLLKTDIAITSPLKWGAYMGSKYTGR